MKIMKAKQRPEGDQNQNFKIFFYIFGYLVSLGVFYFMISIFVNFKVVKAKKATLLAGVAFFYLRKFTLSKLVF